MLHTSKTVTERLQHMDYSLLCKLSDASMRSAIPGLVDSILTDTKIFALFEQCCRYEDSLLPDVHNAHMPITASTDVDYGGPEHDFENTD